MRSKKNRTRLNSAVKIGRTARGLDMKGGNSIVFPRSLDIAKAAAPALDPV